jgi:hypothetical protein
MTMLRDFHKREGSEISEALRNLGDLQLPDALWLGIAFYYLTDLSTLYEAGRHVLLWPASCGMRRETFVGAIRHNDRDEES